jgi:ribosomal protein S18 acetylase RimI-like enzyme
MARQSRIGHRTGIHDNNAASLRPSHPVGYALPMPTRKKADEDAAVDANKLKRETAGRYTTADGRFTVEQGSGGWMITDAEQTNELGLPLVRGPFGTLDVARDGLDAAREGQAPTSELAGRMAELKGRGGEAKASDRGRRRRAGRGAGREAADAEVAEDLQPPKPVEIREFRARDVDELKRLWADSGIDTSDDAATLKRLAERNPGLLLVATQDKAVIGSALGAWDGRRGWIYHVAAAREQRRSGVATRLVREVEERLRAQGAQKVNVVVRDDNPAAALFWEAAGYERMPTRMFRRDLGE